MTVGDIIDILEQFPRDQVLEMGILTKEDPNWITCLPIADILISEKHLIIVDPDSSQLVQEIIGSRLNVRRTGNSDKGAIIEEKAAPAPSPPDAGTPPPALSDGAGAAPCVLSDGVEQPEDSSEG